MRWLRLLVGVCFAVSWVAVAGWISRLGQYSMGAGGDADEAFRWALCGALGFGVLCCLLFLRDRQGAFVVSLWGLVAPVLISSANLGFAFLVAEVPANLDAADRLMGFQWQLWPSFMPAPITVGMFLGIVAAREFPRARPYLCAATLVVVVLAWPLFLLVAPD